MDLSLGECERIPELQREGLRMGRPVHLIKAPANQDAANVCWLPFLEPTRSIQGLPSFMQNQISSPYRPVE